MTIIARFFEVIYWMVAVLLLNQEQIGPERFHVDGKCIPQGATNAGPTYGTIEAAVVVSSELASSFTEMAGHEHRHLLDYLRVLFSAVNLNLQRTDTEILDLQLVVTDIIVLKEYSEFLNERFSKNHDLIAASSPFRLTNYMKTQPHVFFGIDAVLYLSSRMFGRQDKGRTTTAKGMAYTGCACSDLGGALIYVDSNTMSSAATLTHEILHLVGSVHDTKAAPVYLKDSPGALNCPDDRKLIMAEYFQPQQDSFLQLSTCTRDQVMAFLRSSRGKCLLNKRSRRWPPLSEANLRKPIVDAGRYCKYLYRNSSVEHLPYYSEQHNIGNCIVVCTTIGADGEKVHHMHSAPDYTDCSAIGGGQKVCKYQICMEVPRKQPPLHEWIMNLTRANIQVSDALKESDTDKMSDLRAPLEI
ncbi:venom metalloproteinase antarease-like TpachMP_A [Dermacentor silvarum]|uniref:venom metalloproteinase antarease-like TpachMP_A n=1 Tax=Dermacentor silvarum TaxID=543639 RepID=UPI002101B87D|nr:venom metalloproteinase antarease-like TpachMP_A [Dermacentor silvarum]XP_049511730.1 venom metalloproteinase antarease-like TpachMP_A [Dermacentor silvarum]XP_049511731.1 venom metalloproteinase antarease-like TpachMP_A [Dermacentor silvarum]